MKKLKHYLTAPGRRIRLYLDSAGKLGYTGFSKFRVALDILWWRRVHHYKADDYVFYEFDKYSPTYRKLFLRDYDQYITYGKLNYPSTVHGKAGQYEMFGKEVINREWIQIDKIDLKVAESFIKENKKVILKPNVGSCGRGVFAFDIADGEKAMKETILSVHGNDYICEQFIEQHEKLSALHPQSVNSIRVLAFNDHNNIQIIAATLKIGGDDKVVDNFRNEGMAANIDIENGIVNTPLFDLNNNCTYFTKTGINIMGFKIPNWDKVCEIAKKSSLFNNGCVILGLDIAVTEDGAALIESNNRPGTRIVQSFDKKPKGKLIRDYCKKYKKELRKLPLRVKKAHKDVY